MRKNGKIAGVLAQLLEAAGEFLGVSAKHGKQFKSCCSKELNETMGAVKKALQPLQATFSQLATKDTAVMSDEDDDECGRGGVVEALARLLEAAGEFLDVSSSRHASGELREVREAVSQAFPSMTATFCVLSVHESEARMRRELAILEAYAREAEGFAGKYDKPRLSSQDAEDVLGERRISGEF